MDVFFEEEEGEDSGVGERVDALAAVGELRRPVTLGKEVDTFVQICDGVQNGSEKRDGVSTTNQNEVPTHQANT